MSWNGVPSKVSFNPGCLYRYKKKYEEEYVTDMRALVEQVVPDYERRRAEGKMAHVKDPDLRKKLIDFINSEDLDRLIYLSQAVRVRVTLPDEITARDKIAISKLEAFICAYRSILRKIVKEGYNPGKRNNKNDFNDLHFLLYLADPQIHLITRDAGIVKKVGSQSSQGNRIPTFEKWLNDQ